MFIYYVVCNAQRRRCMAAIAHRAICLRRSDIKIAYLDLCAMSHFQPIAWR